MINRLLRLSIHPLLFVFFFLALMTGQWVQLITLFGIVLFHEWGHLLWATYFGWKVDRVLLLPFGGVMEVSSPLLPPAREEAAVVLGGPMNNLLLAALAYLLRRFGLIDPAWGLFLVEGSLLLGMFNLLPLYPLDGGRLFQLAASYFMPYRRALFFTLSLGVLLLFSSLLLMGLGFLPSLSLWFLLPYLLYTSFREYRHIPYRMVTFLLMRYLHRRKRRTPFAILSVHAEESLHHASFGMYRHRYHLFRVRPGLAIRDGGGEGRMGPGTSRYIREERLLAEMFARKNPTYPIGLLEGKEEFPD